MANFYNKRGYNANATLYNLVYLEPFLFNIRYHKKDHMRLDCSSYIYTVLYIHRVVALAINRRKHSKNAPTCVSTETAFDLHRTCII
jgi:hypothetical protein